MLENNDQNIKMKYDVSEVLCTYKVKTRSEHRVKVSKDIIREELDINIKNTQGKMILEHWLAI